MRDRLAVYLGYGVAMFGDERKAPSIHEHPPAWPVSRVLSALALPQKRGKRLSVRVYLGGFYCPIISFAVPSDLKGAAEVHAIATHAATRDWGCSAAEVEVALDWARVGMAAAMHVSTREAIRSWEATENIHVSSIKPLWSTATNCAAVRRHQGKELVVQEPGTATMIPDGVENGRAATSIAVQESVTPKEEALKLTFGTQSAHSEFQKDLPAVWNSYWSVMS